MDDMAAKTWRSPRRRLNNVGHRVCVATNSGAAWCANYDIAACVLACAARLILVGRGGWMLGISITHFGRL